VNCNGVGGNKIDPKGDIRLCGRAKPADWMGGVEGEYAWDPERYFHGQLAHFAVFDRALNSNQAKNLRLAYINEYELYSSSKIGTGFLVGIICSTVGTIGVTLLAWKFTKKNSGNEQFYPNNQDKRELA